MLDRIYTSLSLAEKCVVLPETLLPHHPHLPGSDSRVSDHFPASLSFGRQLAKHSHFRIPEWVARLQAVRDRLAGLPDRGHPVRRLCRAKRAIRCGVSAVPRGLSAVRHRLHQDQLCHRPLQGGRHHPRPFSAKGVQVCLSPFSLPSPRVGQPQLGLPQRAPEGCQHAGPGLQAGAVLRARLLQRLSPHRAPAQLPEHGQAHAAAAELHAHAAVQRHGRLHPGPAGHCPRLKRAWEAT